MKREVPRKIAGSFCALVDAPENGDTRDLAQRILRMTAQRPMMLEREIHAEVPVNTARAQVSRPNRRKVLVEHVVFFRFAQVIPHPVALQFVANYQPRQSSILSF